MNIWSSPRISQGSARGKHFPADIQDVSTNILDTLSDTLAQDVCMESRRNEIFEMASGWISRLSEEYFTTADILIDLRF